MKESQSKTPGTARESSLDALSKTIDGLEARIDSLVSRRLASATAHLENRSQEGDRGDEAGVDRPDTTEILRRQQILDRERASLEARLASRRPAQAAPASEKAMQDIARSLVDLRQELKHDFSETLTREISALRGEVASAAQNRTQPLPPAMREELLRLSECIERFGEHYSPQKNAALAEEVHALRSSLDGLAAEHRQGLSSVVQKIGEADPQTLRSEVVGLVQRLEQMQGAIGGLGDPSSVAQVEDQLKAVAGALETLAEQVNLDEASIDHRFAGLTGRLDEISRAIVSVGARADRTQDGETLARIESRVAALAERINEFGEAGGSLDHLAERMAGLVERIDTLASEDSVAALGERLDHLSAYLEEGARHGGQDELARGLMEISAKIDALDDGALGQALAGRFDQLAARIDALAGGLDSAHEDMFDRLEALAGHTAPDMTPALANLEERLSEIVGHLDATRTAAPGGTELRGLETQLAHLSELISRPASAQQDEDGLASRLAAIEEHLQTNDEYVIEAARQAAEAVMAHYARSGSAEQPYSGDIAVISELAEDLRALEKLGQKSEERTARAFDAVHDTLLKIAEHLENLGEGHRTVEHDVPEDGSADDGHGEQPAEEIRPAAGALRAPVARKVTAKADDELGHLDESDRLATAEQEVDDVFGATGIEDEDVRPERSPGLLTRVGRRIRPGRRKDQSEEERAEPEPARQDVGVAPSIDPSDTLGADDEIGEDSDALVSPNEPLEPGSGVPDIERILRKVRESQGQEGRDDDRSDFIAAARRAAQAAAAEVEVAGNVKDGKRRRGLAAILKSQRRPILLAVGAILLVVMSWPLAQAYLKRPHASAVARKTEKTDPQQMASVAHPAADKAKSKVSGETTGSTGKADNQLPKVRALPQPASTASAVRAAKDRPTVADNSTKDGPPLGKPAAGVSEASTAKPTAPAADAATGAAAETMPSSSAPVVAKSASASPATGVSGTGFASTSSTPDATELQSAAAALPVVPATIGPESLRIAAAKGDPKALYEIGVRYSEGSGVGNDFAAAAKWYRAAADRGLAPAEYRLANLYEKGQGVDRDVNAALKWYLKAADQGNVSAMHNLAVLYAMGTDGKPDYQNAAKWFRKAADHGVKDSQFNLAILYAQGNGVPRDMTQSYKWFALAGSQGDADSNHKRDQVAAVLSAADLKKAREEVSAWKPLPVDPAANTVAAPADWKAADTQTASIDMKKAIRNIQAILDNNGFDAGKPDGVMGDKTRSAIKAFQKSIGDKPTGEVNDALIKKLLELNAKRTGNKSS